MPKKKNQGLGKDITKSLETMEVLAEDLKAFINMPIKEGLASNRIADEKLLKAINGASEEAVSLFNKIKDLCQTVSGVKSPGNSRFAQKIVSKFLDQSVSF